MKEMVSLLEEVIFNGEVLKGQTLFSMKGDLGQVLPIHIPKKMILNQIQLMYNSGVNF